MDEGQRGAAQRSIEVDNSRSVADAQNHTIHFHVGAWATACLIYDVGVSSRNCHATLECLLVTMAKVKMTLNDVMMMITTARKSIMTNVVATTRLKVMMMKQ